MVPGEPRALYQRFLPDRRERAFVWKYDDAVGGRRPRHFHEEPEVNVVLTGSATFGVGARTVRVAEGEILAFPAGLDHVLLEASPDLYLYAVGLEPTYSAAVLGPRQESVGPCHARLGSSELARVVEGAATLVDRRGAEQLGAELWERVHWLARRSPAGHARAAHVLTRRTLKLVGEQPDRGLDGLAGELRTHPSEVSRHFHADMGMTLVRYRTRLRLMQLIRLVDAGHADLMAAAGEAGFGSYSQCHRAFHAELGCAPARFFAAERERMQLAYVG